MHTHHIENGRKGVSCIFNYNILSFTTTKKKGLRSKLESEKFCKVNMKILELLFLIDFIILFIIERDRVPIEKNLRL